MKTWMGWRMLLRCHGMEAIKQVISEEERHSPGKRGREGEVLVLLCSQLVCRERERERWWLAEGLMSCVLACR